MAKARTVQTHEDDLLALEKITSVPAGLIEGYVIILTTTGNDSRVITNSCCVWHALKYVDHLAQDHLDGIAPCHDDPT